MAVHASHAALPYPIKGARYTVDVVFMDANGVPTDPVTPDTEISKDNGNFADCAEEVAVPGTNRGGGMITLSGAEMDCSTLKLWLGVASGPKPSMMTIQPRVLPVAFSGTATGGSGSTITLATSVPAIADLLIGCIVRTTGGTGGGGTGGANNQARVITAFPASRVATVVPNWEVSPSSDTTYEILLTEAAVLRFADVRRWNAADVPTSDTAGYPKVTIKDGTGTGELDTASGKVQLVDASITSSTFAAGAINAAAIATDAITAAKIATDALGAAELAADAVTEIGSALASAIAAVQADTDDIQTKIGTPSVSLAADVAAVKSDTAAIKLSNIIREGTAQAGAANTITLDAGASAVNDFYKNKLVLITGGTGVGQAEFISSYVGSTKVATMAANWVTNPDSSSVFKIIPFGTLAAGGAGSGAANVVRENTAQAGSTSTTLKLDTGASSQDDFYNDNVVWIYGGTGAGETNTISDYTGSTRVATMIKAWIVTPDNTSQFRIIAAGRVPGTSVPTAVENADAVWNATDNTHNAASSMGKRLNDVGKAQRNKKNANQVSGIEIVFEDDGVTPCITRKLQKGASEDVVELVPQ